MSNKNNQQSVFPVVITYSFDWEVPVYLCTSYEEATALIKKDYEEELRIQTEENGHVHGEDLTCSISEGGDGLSYAQMFIDAGTGEEPDVIEWNIGTVKEIKKGE